MTKFFWKLGTKKSSKYEPVSWIHDFQPTQFLRQLHLVSSFNILNNVNYCFPSGVIFDMEIDACTTPDQAKRTDCRANNFLDFDCPQYTKDE